MTQRKPKSGRPRITVRKPSEPKLVKSATRVLEILEFFDDHQQPATVMEIANALDYPQSSTSALLRSLVTTGYVNYDMQARTYVTSARVALLGSWVNAPFFAEGALMSLLKELNEQTGDTVVLAIRNGLYVQYIHVIQATSMARLHIALGTVRPLAASGAGYALLATMSDAEVSRLVMRINADATDGQPLIRQSELLAQLERVRAQGYAFSCNTVTPGGGMMAVALPRMSGQPVMVVGIGGISEIMKQRESELAGIMLGAVGRRFGLDARKLAGRNETVQDPLSLAIMRARLGQGR